MSFSLGRTSATLSLSVCFDRTKRPVLRVCIRFGRQVGSFRARPYDQFLSTPLTDFVTVVGVESSHRLPLWLPRCVEGHRVPADAGRLPRAAVLVEARTLNQAAAS
jgi:hypothetical protein